MHGPCMHSWVAREWTTAGGGSYQKRSRREDGDGLYTTGWRSHGPKKLGMAIHY